MFFFLYVSHSFCIAFDAKLSFSSVLVFVLTFDELMEFVGLLYFFFLITIATF